MLNEKRKILFFIKILPILSLILMAVILIVISIIGINKYFKQEIKDKTANIKAQAVYNSTKHIKAINGLVDNIYLVVKKSFQKDIKNNVIMGYNMLSIIYNENKKLPKNVILKKIKNNLENIRFYKDKSGYFFIYDMSGKVIMLPIKKELEGKNLINHKDIKGKYIVKEFIEGLKNKNLLYKEWYYYNPITKKTEKKIGYGKYFAPLDIFIGSAVYEKNIKKESYKRIRQIVSRINRTFINQSFAIILDNNKFLYSNKIDLKQYQNIINIAKKNPDNVMQLKQNNNLIVFKYYKPLKMTLLAIIDLNKLKILIEKIKNDINKIVGLVIKQFLFTALLFIIVISIITYYLTKLVENIFIKYEKSLKEEKEKAQNAVKVKSEFLANMSHEIRTPLNAMFGFIRILQEKELDNESKKYLNIIEKSGQNLLTIINDILDFSKIEAGKFKIEKIEFNPKTEIEVIYELFATKASEKNILLEIKEKNLKYNIISDPTRIKQVIANLLSNAIKFTPENKKIDLILKYNDKKEELFVCIKDEGIGISKDKLKHIFEAFSQADNSTTRKYGGTGLGLSISYKLVHLLGGELKVKSEINKGSEFYFIIPAKKGSLAKDITIKKEKIEDQKFDYHILVVEDNMANQMFMKVILKKMGVTFDIANNGKEAVEMFEKNRYDLILMDENMPVMNGIEATKKIREIEREKGLEHTIITALTANALEGDKDRFILAGMDYYLSKPLDIEKLKEIFTKI